MLRPTLLWVTGVVMIVLTLLTVASGVLALVLIPQDYWNAAAGLLWASGVLTQVVVAAALFKVNALLSERGR
jgi:hypothetical protein